MLITPSEVASFIGGLDVSDDDEVQVLIESADALLASWCGWASPDGADGPTLVRSTYTEHHAAPESTPGRRTSRRRIGLDARVIALVTSLEVDPTGDYLSPTVVDATDYALRGSTLCMASTAAALPTAPESIRVTLEAGFDEDTVPHGVRLALLLTVRDLYPAKTVEGLPNGLDVSPLPSESLPIRVRTLMSRYRRVSIA